MPARPSDRPLILLLCLVAACDAGPGPADGRSGPDSAADGTSTRASPDAAAGDRAAAPSRPATRADTLRLEGMPQPITLELFRAEDDFPLPFTTYVPGDMEARRPGSEDPRTGRDGGGAAVEFVTAFAGQARPDASIHLYVFPPGTDRNQAVALARAYQTSQGIPVSQGLEPLADADAARRMPWATEAYAFRHQTEAGWYVGAIGVGEHDGRFFQIVTHYPAEMGDGFGPRAAMILETWLWADGTRLMPGSD